MFRLRSAHYLGPEFAAENRRHQGPENGGVAERDSHTEGIMRG